jgi:TolB-like protein
MELESALEREMTPDSPPVQAVRDALQRVLASAGFVRNERLSRFLRFVVEHHLAGRDGELKESVIGIEVLGRKPGFDPKLDSTVRSEAARLRARLLEYYAGAGNTDPVRISLPKGGYIPLCQPLDVAHQAASGSATPRTAHSGAPARVILLAVAALLGLGWWAVSRRSAVITVAVLPLQNVSPNPADEYLADGLTDELIHQLSRIDGIAPRSRTSSFVFKGKPREVRDVGRQLGADYILEGSILRRGDQLRVNVQFVRVRDDRALWSGRFDRSMSDILTTQDEISRGIVHSLRLNLGGGQRRYGPNLEAYDLYLRARAMEADSGLRGLSDSVGAFKAVVAKDSLFAPAYAGLAEAHAVRSQQFRFDLPAEVAQMREAADTAIRLDPFLAEAHDALGTALARTAQWKLSEKSFRRAIELEPSNSETHRHYAFQLLYPLGRFDEALREFAIAAETDPLSPQLHFQMVYVLLAVSRFDEAAVHCDKLPAGFWGRSECLARVRLGQGRTADAVDVLETAFRQGQTPGSEIRGLLGYAYARAGRREDAEKIAAMTPSINPFNFALIFAGLGDKDRCFEALNRAVAAGPYRIGWVLAFPEFAMLRGDPRVKALRKKVGLPEG